MEYSIELHDCLEHYPDYTPDCPVCVKFFKYGLSKDWITQEDFDSWLNGEMKK